MEANTSRMVNVNGVNYAIWKGKMKDLLYVKIFYKPVFTTVKPDNMTNEEWSLLHRQVCGFIRQWVDDNVLNFISGRHMLEPYRIILKVFMLERLETTKCS